MIQGFEPASLPVIDPTRDRPGQLQSVKIDSVLYGILIIDVCPLLHLSKTQKRLCRNGENNLRGGAAEHGRLCNSAAEEDSIPAAPSAAALRTNFRHKGDLEALPRSGRFFDRKGR